MRIFNQMLSYLLIGVLLGACSGQVEKTAQDNQKEKTEQTTKKESNHTNSNKENAKVVKEGKIVKDESTTPVKQNDQADTIASIRKQLKTDLPILLPNRLPIKMGKYLTATTTSKKNQFTVVFYETDKQLSINDPSLKKMSKDNIIAKYKAVKYDSLNQANDEISFEDYSKVGGQRVNLGHHIMGYQDAGAGSLWTSWNEGRWALATHTRTANSERGLELAKQAVEFLEKNLLPIPKPNGSIRLDAMKSTENNVRWQNKTIVYSIEKVKNPIDVLKIATSIK